MVSLINTVAGTVYLRWLIQTSSALYLTFTDSRPVSALRRGAALCGLCAQAQILHWSAFHHSSHCVGGGVTHSGMPSDEDHSTVNEYEIR
jgi:hypothetical protein